MKHKWQIGKEKGTFGKVGPIGCLHSSDDTEEERNEVRGRGAGKRVGSTRLDDREKQNEIRIWPKKKQRYGYHDRSPSIKKNLSKSLRVSGAFKHPKYARVVNDIAFLIENDDSFIKTKLFKFLFQKKSVLHGWHNSYYYNHAACPILTSSPHYFSAVKILLCLFSEKLAGSGYLAEQTKDPQITLPV
ncbi:hypothetical protein V6N12_068115 [Hibiscus sabdariffa]|uniref:Uncharacterized protein n=1 Tax=Hibiscus sabdariffa TaxID=183260 RepID=A0ABR2FPB3_9ROSI